ncbi:DNA pilot protein [Microviridae sp.]|nr:DNA pilot protein [Microviridae sp.]
MAFIEAGINAASQQATNAANAIQAQKNRDFQKEMSSTAHQREVEDLKKAGLNPILSATGGSGASAPSGNVANFKAGTLGTDLMQFANSAADTKNKKSQNDVIQAEEKQLAATTLAATENARLAGTKADSQQMQNDIDAEVKPVKVQAVQKVKSLIGQASDSIKTANSAKTAHEEIPPAASSGVGETTIRGTTMRNGKKARAIEGGLYRDSYGGKYGIYDSDGNKLSRSQIDQLRKQGIIK